jgi:hypothetical protein
MRGPEIWYGSSSFKKYATFVKYFFHVKQHGSHEKCKYSYWTDDND